MGVPLHQAVFMGSYILKKRIKGEKYYPINLMLEPLFRCNLACPGCGKIQYPEEDLKKRLSVEECLNAARECDSPMVTLPGGEPLIHPEMPQIIEGLINQNRYVVMCTNALLLERRLHELKPHKKFTLNIHLDGYKERHDHAVDREGVYEVAIKAIKAAKEAGFRVTTNTTVFEGASIENLEKLFDILMEMGVEGLTISPGFNYEKAPDQDHFFAVKKTRRFFKELLDYNVQNNKKWVFNHSPFYLDFLVGKKEYDCSPWGMPTYNIFGWQKPCYLLTTEGYEKSYQDYLQKTEFEKYGRSSGNPKCANCMTHCGYEPSAVRDGMQNPIKMLQMGIAAAKMG